MGFDTIGFTELFPWNVWGSIGLDHHVEWRRNVRDGKDRQLWGIAPPRDREIGQPGANLSVTLQGSGESGDDHV